MRLVIVEDDPLLLESLKLLLTGETGINVVGAYQAAEYSLGRLDTDKPEVILADLGLPGMSGIEYIKKVKESMPDVEILAHTVFEDRENVFSAIKAGASGYLLKGSSPRDILEAIHEINKGGAPMSRKIAQKVIREFQDKTIVDNYVLNQQEKNIVKCIEQGLTYKEISDRLGIGSHTVHTHIKNIYEKLQAKDRQEVIIKASRHHLLDLSPKKLFKRSKNQEIDKFKLIIASTSHSLKNELMHIHDSIDFLRQSCKTSANEDRIDMIERSTQYAQLFLRKLLDLVDVGKPVIELVDVTKLVQKTVGLVKPRLLSNIHLEVLIIPVLRNYIIRANTEQIMEVLIELIQNASASMIPEGGTIELRVEQRDEEVALSVRDSGPGIPEKVKKDLFVREVESKHGLGLGLFLSSKIIRSFGGKLIIENTSNKGTTITILMPMVINEKERKGADKNSYR